MTYFQALLLALVEGLTEFLPVSSTGHMIIVQSALQLRSTELVKLFTVSIQFGAILSVLVLYWRRFLQDFAFYTKLVVAFLPAAVIGFLLGDEIDQLLESVLAVAVSLVAGGVVLVLIDRFLNPSRTSEVTLKKSLAIGFFQCIALIPGVSRSAATIIGGMFQGLTRQQAAEFSFFLAVPTMAAASGYKLLKTYLDTPEVIHAENIRLLVFGNAVAFVVGALAIKFFISFLTRHGFFYFGIYRIILGGILLILMAMGVPMSIS
ncbi:MAG TPA: undecaprenyl-diphosphate phosphatase [Luteibaculaceae bacterium]|nr:undecaprenyl-diphosphate phosphatase [Luteibaculaceae bacterium]